MAHFARLDTFGTVTGVEVVSDFFEGRELDYCNHANGTYRQCSYNGKIRKNFPSQGYTYDATRDAFIPPKDYPSWTLNEETCRWEAPVAYPSDGEAYNWDEETKKWVLVTFD